ncbi:hypothetical protein GCM10010178_42400 [Lentzea flava]|uniref:DUF397 domain-containing protein n=1 Tax=Lentzea flava TaxID=103732 RepID=A0ABQ2UQB7_9PSEU|nr:protein of unknown function (DUF397) [Lentzea flava]GGU45503.1 hypothetical protein GCM10010178_42400 [Lentzea flava]
MVQPDNLEWRKSSYSSKHNDECVEVALPGDALVRDSKNPKGAVLGFTSAAWATFLHSIPGAEGSVAT